MFRQKTDQEVTYNLVMIQYIAIFESFCPRFRRLVEVLSTKRNIDILDHISISETDQWSDHWRPKRVSVCVCAWVHVYACALEGIIRAPRSNLASRMHILLGTLYFEM